MHHPEPDLAERTIMANFCGWHIVGRLVFQRPFGNSSGSLITSLFNCFCNFWIHKSAWLTVYDESDFWKVALSFVGDDSVFSAPDTYPKYNMQLISDFCRRELNMVYTAPDKTQNMTMDWESLVFLKRRFVESPVGVLAPLDPASLSDMVKWSSSDDSEKTVESTFTSLLTECWHYGEETFKKVEAWCRLEARRNGLHLNLPDWTAMRAARLLDYRVGCAAGLGDYSGSPWYLRATSWINKKLLEIFGQKASST